MLPSQEMCPQGTCHRPVERIRTAPAGARATVRMLWDILGPLRRLARCELGGLEALFTFLTRHCFWRREVQVEPPQNQTYQV